jgi:hypothetical protein
MPTQELRSLRRELESPRLSRLRSSLGLAVPSAALRAFDDAPFRPVAGLRQRTTPEVDRRRPY